MIITISGKAQHGKDTAADYLVEKYGFTKLAYGDRLKTVVADMFGLNIGDLYTDAGKKKVHKPSGKTYRQLLQDVGEGMREIYSKVWVDTVIDQIIGDRHFVICDARHLDEVCEPGKRGAFALKLEIVDKPGLPGKSGKHVTETFSDEPDSFFHKVIRTKNGEKDKMLAEIDRFIQACFDWI